MVDEALFSSKNLEWETPKWLFDKLDKEFHFTLDPCASEENHKCKKYYTKEDDGLTKSWKDEVVFMNPPYGRNISKWIEKAWWEATYNESFVVCLIPARTDTKYWHKYCMQGWIRFIKGRLKFGNAKNHAPFPSAIIIFPREFFAEFNGGEKLTVCETFNG